MGDSKPEWVRSELTERAVRKAGSHAVADTLAFIGALAASTSPVSLTIGTVDDANMVRHNVIVVTDAPPRVLSQVIAAFPGASLDARGVVIHVGSPEARGLA